MNNIKLVLRPQFHLRQYQKYKILGNIFNKGGISLYTENYKTWLKEIKEDSSK